MLFSFLEEEYVHGRCCNEGDMQASEQFCECAEACALGKTSRHCIINVAK
jgi:hypothetical protein